MIRRALTRPRTWVVLGLAAVAYVPLLLTARGQIAADTKAYLYLDPGRLMSRAGLMWDTHVMAGTVTHQNIGYLFPLGPYYWILERLGVPTWIAERLWLGTLLFAAGAGTMWMLRRLGLRGPGVVVGGFTYMLSPYLLAYAGRTSVILLPWACLPWLIGLVAVALRDRRWRAPALIAVVVTLMAGTNASSVVFVLIGPALLLPYMVWVTREVTLRSALGVVGRTAVMVVPAQLWWLAGLWVQGRYGLPILQLTETQQTVAQTSTAPELLRGLGYWYFYGRDGLSQWTNSSILYTQNPGMLAIGFVLPSLALVGAMLTRWRYRAFFVALTVLGLVLGIGTYPYDSPSPFGAVVKAASANEAGFALRNSPRALPLLVLGLAALLASFVAPAVHALVSARRAPWVRRTAPALVVGLLAVALLGLPPLWRGSLVSPDLQFPETLPQYWQDAAAHLDATGDDTRVIELPGSDFAAYRWGQTQDPVTPGIIDRPWIGRELTAYGTPGSTDLARALDTGLQEGPFDIRSLVPVARLLSASDVLLRMDTQYERYRGPRPADLWSLFGEDAGTAGLGPATTFGDRAPAVADPRQPTRDEQELARPTDAEDPPPLAVYPVDDVRPIVRAESRQDSLVLWGDGRGLVDAAAVGLVPDTAAIFYAPTLLANPAARSTVTDGDPSLVVTDTNRRRAQRWGTIRENDGATEAAGSTPLVEDPKDTRLDLFPGATDDQMTVADYGTDVADVRASSYGNIVAYSSEARPVNAIDGDPRTAWSTGGYSEVVGDRLRVDYRHPVTADHIDLSQLRGNRFITEVSVAVDGATVATVDLGDDSFTDQGQRIDLGGDRTFTSLEVTIDAANVSGLVSFDGFSNVGIRELTVPGVEATEWIRLPAAGLSDMSTATSPLDYLFTRWRANAVEGFRQDPELRLARIFTVPDARPFSLSGEARIGGRTDGAVVDALVGRPGLDTGYPVVTGDDYLSGALADRPSSALDGDLTTAWTLGFGNQDGRGFTVVSPTPMTVDHLDLSVVADGSHSVPTSLVLTLDDSSTRTVAVPPITDSAEAGATTTVTVPVEAFTSSTVKVTIGSVRAVVTPEYFSGDDHTMPVAIAELGLPTTVGPLPTDVPDTCRSGLMTLDGTDVPVRLGGTVADALDRQALTLTPCDPAPTTLGRGEHRLLTAAGLDSGVDIDRLQLASNTVVAGASRSGDDGVPTTTVTSTGDLSYRVEVSGATDPFWLVLGQSLSDGWTAKVRGGPSLGAPMLIDGFANGWSVDPAVTGSTFTVDLVWTPQRVVWAAVGVSALWFIGVLAVLGLATRARRRRRSRRSAAALAADQAASDGLGYPPRLDSPWIPIPLASLSARLVTVASMAVLGWFVAGPLVGLVMAALTAVAAWWQRGRTVLAATPLVMIGATVVLYVGRQVRRHYAPGVEWPSGFAPSHQLVLIAVLAVVAEVAVRFCADRWPQRAQRATAANQMNDGSAVTR